MALSGVTADDELDVLRLSFWSLVSHPWRRSARQVLAYIVFNRLPAPQKHMRRLPYELIEESSLCEGGVSQLHVACAGCGPMLYRSKLLFGSKLRFGPRTERYQLYDNFTSLELAAASGCHFCTLLLNLPQSEQQLPENKVFVQIVRRHRCGIELYVSVAPQLGIYNSPMLPKYSGVKIETASSPGWFHAKGAVSIPHLAQLCNYTGSGYHISLARSWLEQCSENHTSCRKPGLSVAARFIRVSRTERDEISIRLHSVSNEDRDIPYCALSHCWGGATDILVLKSSNLKALEREIDMRLLAKTFQNAIALTHALEIEFLWIDCLCIIQDSKEDWLHESARMGQIYEGAKCTIMAAAARNPHEGLFQTRNPLSYSPFMLTGAPSNGLFMLPPGKNGTMDEVTKAATLQTRAWTFQESFLSPRKLYFGPHGLYWSCFLGEATERDPQGRARERPRVSNSYEIRTIFGRAHSELQIIPFVAPLDIGNGLVTAVTRLKKDYTPDKNDVFGQLAHPEHKRPKIKPVALDYAYGNQGQRSQDHGGSAEFHAEWFQIVEEYSGRQLTRQNDKLVALSGIATRIQQDSGYHYLAGLWRESLLLDLLWHIDPHENPMPPHPRAKEYMAPTWSWASIPGRATSPLLLPDLAQVSLVEVLSVSIVTAEQDIAKTGSVSDGILIIKGKPKKIDDIRSERHANAGTSHRRGDAFVNGEELGWVDLDISVPLNESGFGPLFILPVVEDIDWNVSNFPCIYGIALVRKSLYWERIGAWQSPKFYKSNSKAMYDWLHEGQLQELKIK